MKKKNRHFIFLTKKRQILELGESVKINTFKTKESLLKAFLYSYN